MAAAAAVAALVLPACQVSTSVGVDAHADGSGLVRAVVTLDRDAAQQAGDLKAKLRVDDLRAAGWRIDGPTPVADGGVSISARKPFATPAEASAVVEQLSGADGPFQKFTVHRSRTWAKTRLSFRGTVDLSRGLGSFSDAQLRQRLGDSGLGFDPAKLESKLGRALSRVFPVKVVATLPGSVTSNAPLKAANGAEWSPQFGEHVVLTASSQEWNTGNLAAAGVAGVAGLALVVLLLVRLVGWLRRRRAAAEPASEAQST